MHELSSGKTDSLRLPLPLRKEKRRSSGSRPARGRGGVLLFSLCLLLLFPGAGEAAATHPSYTAVKKRLPQLWKERYPLQALSFASFPRGRRILYAVHRGKAVYYYRFMAVVPRPHRTPGGNMENRGERKLELWVRYRPRTKENYSITFARIDLLPGGSRRWIR